MPQRLRRERRCVSVGLGDPEPVSAKLAFQDAVLFLEEIEPVRDPRG
jgi:hypothetical protein